MSAEGNAGSLFGSASSLSTASPAPTEGPPSGGEGNDLIPPVCTLLITPDGSDQASAYQVNNGEVTIEVDEIVPAYTIDDWEYDSYRFQFSFRGTIVGNRIEGSTHMIHHPQKSRGLVGKSGSSCTNIFSFDVTESSTLILSPDGTYRSYVTPTGGQITKQRMDDCAAGGLATGTDVSPPNDTTMEYKGTWSLGDQEG